MSRKGNRKGEKERDQEQGQRKAGRPVFPPGRCMRAEGCISCPSLWVFAFVFVFLKRPTAFIGFHCDSKKGFLSQIICLPS